MVQGRNEITLLSVKVFWQQMGLKAISSQIDLLIIMNRLCMPKVFKAGENSREVTMEIPK